MSNMVPLLVLSTTRMPTERTRQTGSHAGKSSRLAKSSTAGNDKLSSWRIVMLAPVDICRSTSGEGYEPLALQVCPPAASEREDLEVHQEQPDQGEVKMGHQNNGKGGETTTSSPESPGASTSALPRSRSRGCRPPHRIRWPPSRWRNSLTYPDNEKIAGSATCAARKVGKKGTSRDSGAPAIGRHVRAIPGTSVDLPRWPVVCYVRTMGEEKP
jgi:hypothetical protein